MNTFVPDSGSAGVGGSGERVGGSVDLPHSPAAVTTVCEHHKHISHYIYRRIYITFLSFKIYGILNVLPRYVGRSENALHPHENLRLHLSAHA